MKIERDWTAKASGAGFVTRFAVRADILSRWPVQDAGGIAHREHWVPAEALDAFIDAIVGPIEVIATFGEDRCG